MADERRDQPYRDEAPEPRKPRGCFFYGCLSVVVLLLLGTILAGVGGYLAYRSYKNFVAAYTDTKPRELPKIKATPEEQKEVDGRVKSFNEKMEAGEAVEPLVLTADDINVLIALNPELRDRAYVTIDGNKITGEVSVPLDEFDMPAWMGLEGRYLNGKATVNVALVNDQLIVTLDGLEVRGQAVPGEVMAQLRTKNLAEQFNKDPKMTEAMRHYESITVEDGKVIIMPRPKAEQPGGVPPQPGEAPPNASPPPPAGALPPQPAPGQ